jgi:asparagine synthase (glutamine-hydrolysing)
LQLFVDFFKQGLDQTSSPLYSHHTRIANSRAAHLFLSPRVKAVIEKRPPTQDLIDSLPSDFGRRTLLEKCQYLEMRTLLQGYLLSSQGDRMLSAHGVEGRFPYLDHHLIEFLAGVPERYRLRGLYDKAILRETFRKDLPPCIAERPKFAFRAPEMYAFTSDPEGIVNHYLHDRNLDDAGVFDAAAVGRLRYRLTHGTPGQFSTRENLAFVQILTTQMLHGLFVQQFDAARGDHGDVTITRGSGTDGVRAAA